MEATPPFPVVSTQRQLAVIMFTDAVGYSAKMHEQELATLNRIERDTEVMRRIIGERSGTVLKSTGDGLLVQFVSAVEAVASAQEIQRFFANRTDPVYAQSALRYRIGIHLGDIFVGNGDAMGDGVNIAARLVAQAQPGGIVISHTVYDVVKNKLPLQVQRVGPQKLKNISEPITLYRVLLDDLQPSTPAAAATAAKVPVAAAPAPRSRKAVVALLLLLVPGLFLLGRFLLQQKAAHEAELSRNQSTRAALDTEMQKSANDPTITLDRPAGHDFARLVTPTPVINSPAVEGAAIRQAAEQSVKNLEAWLAANLPRHTRDRPLQVNGLGNQPRTVVFLDAQNQLNFQEGGASRRMDWTKLKPALQGAIIVSALRDAPPPIPPAVRQGAAAFAYLHGLPEMIAALER